MGHSGLWADKHQVFLLQEPVGMCGTSAAAEVGPAHHPPRAFSNCSSPAVPHQFNCLCWLIFLLWISATADTFGLLSGFVFIPPIIPSPNTKVLLSGCGDSAQTSWFLAVWAFVFLFIYFIHFCGVLQEIVCFLCCRPPPPAPVCFQRL